MHARDFEKIVENRFEDCRKTLGLKAGEYAPNEEDRFHNFRLAGAMNNEMPERAAWGMLSKHIISVRDMAFSTKEVTEEHLSEKIRDFINYALLIEGIMRDRHRVREPMHTEKILGAPMYRREPQ